MNTTNTKWRLLEPNEILQDGDEYWSESWEDDDGVLQDGEWEQFNAAPFCARSASEWDSPVRRQMTPAEIHAEELMSALLDLLSLDEFDETVRGVSSRRTAIMNKARAARAKV